MVLPDEGKVGLRPRGLAKKTKLEHYFVSLFQCPA